MIDPLVVEGVAHFLTQRWQKDPLVGVEPNIPLQT